VKFREFNLRIDMIDLRMGDCLTLMNDIPSGSIDLILCDLPYGTTVCKWDSVIPFEELWQAYERVIKPAGAIVLTDFLRWNVSEKSPKKRGG